MDLTNQLRNFRKTNNWTQKQIAEILDIPQTTWSSYETGQANPPLKILKKLAEMGCTIPELTTGSAPLGIKSAGALSEAFRQAETDAPELFKFSHGKSVPILAEENDTDALILLPVYGQTAAAGPGQPETQLSQIETYLPIVYEMLGGANPKNCGIVRVVGDSMTDMSIFNGDFVIFDSTQTEGDGVFVISIGTDVRVKHLEWRPIERKIVISSENAKRYPNPEVITYEQAENLLRIHGKVICWMHRHPY